MIKIVEDSNFSLQTVFDFFFSKRRITSTEIYHFFGYSALFIR